MITWIRKNFVIVIYAVALLTMNIFMINSGRIINYIRYIYTLFIVVYALIKYKNLKVNLSVLFVCVILFIHTIFFGFILAKGDIQSGVLDNGKERLVFIFFVYFTSYYIKEEKKHKEFLLISCIVVTIFTNINYFLHFNGWAPIKFIPELLGFGDSSRVRFDFGYVSYNTAAYATLPSLIFPLLVLNKYYKINRFESKIRIIEAVYLILSIIIAFLVILSTQTRIAILLAVLIVVIITMLFNKKVIAIFSKLNWKIIFIATLVLLSVYAFYIFGNQNSRSTYIPINLNIFNEFSNKWLGMGYLDYSAYLSKSFGYNTAPMDNFYAYILCSTGAVGLVLVVLAMLVMLVKFSKILSSNQSTNEMRVVAVLYIAMLFVSFTESNWIAVFKPESYLYWILYFVAIIEYDFKLIVGKNRNTYMQQFAISEKI